MAATNYPTLKTFKKSEINGLTKRLASYRYAKDSTRKSIDDLRRGMGMEYTNVIYKEVDGYLYEVPVYHFDKPRKITKEQTELGISWIKEFFFKKDGTPRGGKRTEEDVFDNVFFAIARGVKRFEFIGVIALKNRLGDELGFAPIYRSYDSKGNYFDYSPIHWSAPVISNTYYNSPLKLVSNG